MMCSFVRWPRKVAQAGLLGLFILISLTVHAQDDGIPVDGFKAVPILTGSTAYFTRVTGGQSGNGAMSMVALRERQMATHSGGSERFIFFMDDTQRIDDR